MFLPGQSRRGSRIWAYVPAPGFAFDPEGPAVLLDDGFRQGQTDARLVVPSRRVERVVY